MSHYFPNGIGPYLAGGLMIGAAVSLAFALTGLITGMSTVFSSTWSFASRLPYFRQDRFLSSRGWRLMLALGLVIGGALFLLTFGHGSTFKTQVPAWRLAVGGFIAGFGARLSNGCTSGHGICGLASFQMPSLLAVLVFLVTAVATAHIVVAAGGAP
jgi:uncharacterized protein